MARLSSESSGQNMLPACHTALTLAATLCDTLEFRGGLVLASTRPPRNSRVSLSNRRRAPGCSQRCACMLPVSQGDCGRAPVHARCSVPWRRSPAASGATAGISCASGAVAGDSQAPCPVAALSRADFLHGTDSAIYPGQAPAPARARPPRERIKFCARRPRRYASQSHCGSEGVALGNQVPQNDPRYSM